MASQGYQSNVHYEALFQGMSVYCQYLPPPSWVPPPDQFDKFPTPTLPPFSPTKLATGPQQPVPRPSSAAAKGKGRAEQASSPKEKAHKDLAPAQSKLMMKGKAPAKHTTLKPANKFSNNTSDDDYMGSDTSDRGNKVIQVKSRPVDKELVKCANCKKDRSQCLINPSMVGKASPACYECFMAKWKCSLYKRSSAKGWRKRPVGAVTGMGGSYPVGCSFRVLF